MSQAPRPSFARDFPRHAALDTLVEAFAHGDYVRVRAEAPHLERSEDDAVRSAARTLLDRTRPDPLAVALLVLTAALLAFLGGWWMAFGRPPTGNGPQIVAPQEPPRAKPSL